jgi:predicted DNA-binding protein with PD1-like motif
MQARQITAETFVLSLQAGDEAMDELSRFARERKPSAAHFSAIGAFRDVVLGYFDVALH